MMVSQQTHALLWWHPLLTHLQSSFNIHQYCKAGEMGAQALYWRDITLSLDATGCYPIYLPVSISDTVPEKVLQTLSFYTFIITYGSEKFQ